MKNKLIAALIVSILCSLLANGCAETSTAEENAIDYLPYLVAAPSGWEEVIQEDAINVKEYAEFAYSLTMELLESEKNLVWSPLSAYAAVAIMAELTETETREQLLRAVQYEEMPALRNQVVSMLRANTVDDGRMVSRPMFSLWINNIWDIHYDIINEIAKAYNINVFAGTAGDGAYSNALRNWINEQTNDFLKSSVEEVSIDTKAALMVALTFSFQEFFAAAFPTSATSEGIFHSPSEDVTVSYMHRESNLNYYWGDGFGAVQVPLKEGGAMWLILPDENRTPAELLEDESFHLFSINPYEWENQKAAKVKLTLPKFKITYQTDLAEGLKKLGITYLFDEEKSDFSPLLSEEGAKVNQLMQSISMAVDEDGISAESLTMVEVYGASAPPQNGVVFTCDHPFLFGIEGQDGAWLYAGVIQNPAE
ncbi:MAG: hypothetical protein IJ773_10955 [Lachnospiraceae bacterium]|nr:hypothetical protein [Lachnospiraceae bacterium]